MLHRTCLALVGLLALAAACGDDSDQPLVGPGYRCDVTNPVQEVVTPTEGVLLFRTPVRETDILRIPVVVTGRSGARTDVPVTFTSSDTSILVVDAAGIVRPRSAGTATVTVESCGKKSTVSIQALPAVARIATAPSQATLIVGDTLVVKAQAVSQTGQTMSDVKVAWSSSGTAAQVSAVDDTTARVRAIAPGTVTITATGEGVTATTTLTIVNLSFAGSVADAQATLSAGAGFTCGVASGVGRGFCWGLGASGQLGSLASTPDSVCHWVPDEASLTNNPLLPPGGPHRCYLSPRRTADLPTFASISAGGIYACGISTAGRAYCWGATNSTLGELGWGQGGGSEVPVLVTSALTFSSISVGGNHACAISGSTAYCWGADESGQLGDWRTVHSTTPIPVTLDPGSGATLPATQVSAGFQHSCAVAADGTAWCWGNAAFGRTGTASGNDVCPTTDSRLPVPPGTPCISPPAQVSSLRFTQVSAGGLHSCAVGTDGNVYCWGNNQNGQLGVTLSDGATFTSIPQRVGATVSFKQVSAGFRHTCALSTSNVVYCWGSNTDLQLGRGAFSPNSANPAPSPIVSGEAAGVTFTRVASGYSHSCAVGSNNRAYCWGSNVFGALGNTLQAAFRGQPQLVANPQ